MPSNCHASSHARDSAVKLLLMGVVVVLGAQFWPGVPICGAIALIAWATSQTVTHRPALLVLSAAVYAPLGVVAVMAQVDLAMRADSLTWAALAGLDAAIAITLLYSLARQTGELLVRG